MQITIRNKHFSLYENRSYIITSDLKAYMYFKNISDGQNLGFIYSFSSSKLEYVIYSFHTTDIRKTNNSDSWHKDLACIRYRTRKS